VILNFGFCPNKIYRCVYTKNCAVVSITLFISVPCHVCVSSCHEHLYVYVIFGFK